MNTQPEMIKDCLTGEMIPNAGAEENRQNLLKYLFEIKEYDTNSIVRGYPLEFEISGEKYSSAIDVVVKSGSRFMMAIKCVAGSVSSSEREIIAASRIACDGQIPVAVATDGKGAVVYDAITGKFMGSGLEAIPSASELAAISESVRPANLDPARLEKMKIVFRTYDMENINRINP